jgi:flagellar motor protein MotB
MAGLVSFAMLTGCVPVEKYNALKMENRTLEEGLATARAESGEQRARADALDAQLKAQNATGGDMAGLVNNLNQRLAAKQSEFDELNKRYAEAIAKAGQAGSLPQPLTDELAKFAADNPDLVTFENGVVKFKSDVTFDLGDATLKPKGKEVIAKFATILNSPNAKGYELLVAGHTDATPVNNPATIQKGHKNNWYLSSHRAISVGDELMKQNVSAQRLGVVGYADQRPAASNATESGREANRRVEVLILPTQVRSTPAPASATPAVKPPANNKDAGVTSPPPSAPANALPGDNK